MDDLLEKLGDVSETLLLPLYARVIESASKDPIIEDPRSLALAERLDPVFAVSDRRLHRKLLARKLPAKLVVSLALRTRAFDRFTSDFLARHPGAWVVSLGCGLDTRFFRTDNGAASWLDVDLPPVIELRDLLLPGSGRRRSLACSATDHSWMSTLEESGPEHCLFLAEGLFMYLPGDEVAKLVIELSRRFPGSELVAEVFSSRWLKWMDGRLMRRKFRRQLHLSEGATFRSGLASSDEMESLAEGIRFLGDWSYFDERHPKLGWMNWMGRFDSFRRVQWVVRYRLGAADDASRRG